MNTKLSIKIPTTIKNSRYIIAKGWLIKVSNGKSEGLGSIPKVFTTSANISLIVLIY